MALSLGILVVLLATAAPDTDNYVFLLSAGSVYFMSLVALGLNHTTASVEMRERVAIAPDAMPDALRDALGDTAMGEITVLSTCNRLELYAWGSENGESLVQWLEHYCGLEKGTLGEHCYLYQDEEAVAHMMRVAGGLDSLVLGEPQILGQMKSAFAVGQQAGTVGTGLHSVFQQVFSIAKRIRTETAIGENPVSVAYAAVSLARQIFSDLKKDTALLIGAGETIELVAQHLREQGIAKVIVANRTLERAQLLAEQFAAEAILLSDIPDYLHKADIVISSTASQLPLLGKGAVESALKRRKHKPMFMVDIAVPRDIEVEVSELEDVYLYSVDDLRDVIEESKRSRQEAAQNALEIVREGVENFVAERRALDSVEIIKAYRTKAEQLRDEELNKALRALQQGKHPEQVLNQLARSLTNKLLHSPTAQLRQAGAQGRHEVMDWSKELFQLDSAPGNDDESAALPAPGSSQAGIK